MSLLLHSAWRNAVTCLLLVAVLTDAVFEDEDAEDTKSGPGVLEIKTMAAVDAMLDRVFFLLRFGWVRRDGESNDNNNNDDKNNRFGTVDTAVMTSLVTAAQLLGEGCRVAHTTNPALMAELGHRAGELVLYRIGFLNFEENHSYEFPLEFSSQGC